MIIGRGLLARSFASIFETSEDWVIFASGVSNSQEEDSAAFLREENLLRSHAESTHGKLVYFSSCGLVVGDTANTPYMAHKRSMEALVLALPGSVVFRLPQVVGNSPNQHTLVNYLRDRIISGEHFSVWGNAERNIIDIDDVTAIAVELLRTSEPAHRVINIAAERSSTMVDIVQTMEATIGRRGNYTVEPKGAPLTLDTTLASQAASRLSLDLGNHYLARVIRKYYGTSDHLSCAAG